MAELSFVVGVVGIITSVLLFIISPLKTFRRIVGRRSTQGFDSLPFILTLLNTALWTYYGLEKTDGLLVVTANGIGAVVEAVYVGLFLVFPPRRMREKTAAFAAVLDVWLLGGAILITHFMLQGDTRIDVIGFLCAGLNIFMYSSTLAATNIVEHTPFLLFFFMFFNGGIWTYYAVLVEDKFLGVSNVIGCLFGVTQLMLYAIYMNDNSSQIISEHLEDQSQHQPLLPSSDGLEDQSQHQSLLPSSDGLEDQSQHQPLLPSSDGLEDQSQHQPLLPSSDGLEDQSQHQPLLPSSDGLEDQSQHQPLLPSSNLEDQSQHQSLLPSSDGLEDQSQHQSLLPSSDDLEDQSQH